MTRKSRQGLLWVLVVLGALNFAGLFGCDFLVDSNVWYLLFSVPFLLYGLACLIRNTKAFQNFCIWAIAITLPITLLSQYNAFGKCYMGSSVPGAGTLYVLVSMGNIVIAGFVVLFAIAANLRARDGVRSVKLGKALAVVGAIICAILILAIAIEVFT